MTETQTIGVVLPSLSRDFIASALAGILRVTAEAGYRVFVFQGEPGSLAARALAHATVSGWIVLVNGEGVPALAPAPVPAVLISASSPDPRYPVILPDNRGGIELVATHLIGHGHSRIAFAGNLDNPDIYERYQGYQATLQAHGLESGPELVVSVDGYSAHETSAAVQRAFGPRWPCTAVVAGTDDAALGVIAAAREAGYATPEEIAVVGFDDIGAAQHSDPPLTTVRQQPAALGATAARALCRMLGGDAAASPVSYVPTVLVQRRSCGCQSLQAGLAALTDAPGASGDLGEPDMLAGRIAQILAYPQPPEPAAASLQGWPGMRFLVAGLTAVRAGEPAPELATLEQACDEAVRSNDNPEALLALARLFERAAAAQPAPAHAAAQLALFLERLRLALFRTRVAAERRRAQALEQLLHINNQLSLVLASAQDRSGQRLGWLQWTTAEAGCLALWSREAGPGQARLTIDAVYSRAGELGQLIGRSYTAAEFPPRELLAAGGAPGQAGYIALLPVRTDARDWGVLALNIAAPDQFALNFDSLQIWLAVVGAALELRAEREELEVAYERERHLADTVRELGSPVIPLLPGMLLVPLVGVIDSRRAQQMVESVLAAVSQQRADQVLFDITGVPLVDTGVANVLLQTARAVTLLGAEASLVGMRPEVAQSIVQLGVDLRMLKTYPSLATALQLLQRAAARR